MTARPRTATRRRSLALLGFLLGLLVLGAVTAAPASAHATVTASSPADGSNVASTPATVSVTFDEAVTLRPGYLKVLDAGGDEVDTGAARSVGDGRTLQTTLRSGLPARAGYLVSFRVVSADGHPVSGSFGFTVGGGSPVPSSAAGPQTSALIQGFLDAATALGFIGITVAGGAWLVVSRRAGVLDSRRARAVVRAGLGLGAAGSAVQLLLHGPYVAGADATASAWSLLGDTVQSTYGVSQIVALAALLLLLALSYPVGRMTNPLQRAQITVVSLAAVLWVVALGAIAASGHARVRTPVWLGLPSTVVHLLAVTTWIGGIAVLLAIVVPRADPAAVVLVRRLSRVALVCVVVIAVSGVVQAWLETTSWAALVDTTYGRLVLVKTGLFLVLVGLGALARRRLTRTDPVRRVRSGMLVEVVVAVAVLAVTSVLVSEPPARTAYATAVAARPAAATARLGGDRTATVTVTPARRGPVTVQVRLAGVGEVESLTLTATQRDRGVGPVPVDLDWDGGATFTATGVDLPVAGRWTFTVTLRVSRFDAVVADATLDLVEPAT